MATVAATISAYAGADAKISSIVRARLARHAGRRMPKVRASFVQSSLESAGRFAGVGQSAVAIAATCSGTG
jgi:hypothetical protein